MRRRSMCWVSLSLSVLVATAACKKEEETPAGSEKPAAAGSEGSASEAPASGPIRVTGIPDENPTALMREYEPMVEILSERLGRKVEYVPVTDYGAAVQGLVAGKIDFAWLGGFTHVQARTMTDVVPLAMRDIDRDFKSVFIAHAKSGVAGPKDLKGKTFAFGSKSSTSGHLMPRHFLMTEWQIDPDKDFKGAPVFSGAHDATAKMVESGKVQAGALNIQVWERMVAEGQVDTRKVKVVWTTPGYVDYVWTARAAVPADVREKFKETFLSLDAADARHEKILDRMGARKYVAASPSDFDAIEEVAKQVGLLKE